MLTRAILALNLSKCKNAICKNVDVDSVVPNSKLNSIYQHKKCCQPFLTNRIEKRFLREFYGFYNKIEIVIYIYNFIKNKMLKLLHYSGLVPRNRLSF